MTLRPLTLEDTNELKEIHRKFFSQEFEFPDFFNNYLSSFVVTDTNNEILVGGGVRVIAEAVLITNKDFSPKKRREALLTTLQASMFTSNLRGFDQLHAFVQDERWLNHLERIGFRKSKGQALVIGV